MHEQMRTPEGNKNSKKKKRKKNSRAQTYNTEQMNSNQSLSSGLNQTE